MKPTTPTIVLTGGGSGGHITPLLSLARELKQLSPECQIVYVGHKGDRFDGLEKNTHDFDFRIFINAGKFRRYQGRGILKGTLNPSTLALNLRDLIRLPASVGSAYKIMVKFKPAIVFSKGGFVSLPVGIAARLRGIPIVTHDSDSVPGLANRIIGRWAKIHATGMPAHFYPYRNSTIRHVGIPIDQRIKKVSPKIQKICKQELNLPADSQVLLLSGGGNGSQILNELLVGIATELLQSNLSLHILHITGQSHQAAIKSDYQKNLPKKLQDRVRTVGFTADFYAYSAAADLIITRAGATTLAELAAAGKACIVIPASFLTGGHQLKNAEYLEKQDAAVVIKHQITPDELLVTVVELLNNDARRWELAKNLYGTAHPNAVTELAKIILQTAKIK